MTKYKNFSSNLWNSISTALTEEMQQNRSPVAVFDADGTLWDTDLGEAFFKFQIEKNLLPDLPKSPWTHYRKMKASGDPRPAYLWLAQINKNKPLELIRSWAQESVRNLEPLPIFEDQKKLVSLLQDNGVQVFVVTASVKWAVEPGAKLLGIPEDHVIGVSTQIENGFITDKADGEMTYKEGKVKALLNHTNQTPPFFASGNSPGDLYLLKAATRLSLAVGASQKGHELFDAEESLREEARKNNWQIHYF